MRPSFIPRLVNGPLFDPLVYVRILNERRALLFDCGHFLAITPRELLLIDGIYISHAHMDHFIGLDYVLRAILHREKPLYIYGPEGITEKVLSKLHAYTWNLAKDYKLAVHIMEIRPGLMTSTSANLSTEFKDYSAEEYPLEPCCVITDEPRYTVKTVVLDHNIPCLAFTLEERAHVNIRGDVLHDRGYISGPWLGKLKECILTGDYQASIEVSLVMGTTVKKVNELMDELVIISPGQKIGYITDIRYSRENVENLKAIASGTDILFIEAFYLDELRDEANRKGHLTARQAGTIAGMLSAKKVIPMHISPRYHGRVEEIMKEVYNAYERASNCG